MLRTTATHWGNYHVESKDGRIVDIHPAKDDPNPSSIGRSLIDAQHPGARVARPAIRRGYLDKLWKSDGEGRGHEPFVEVPWDEALDIAAAALSHVREGAGNEAIYGGSYGWASAGRFHHAQSQIHRFLNCFGGYVGSRHTYSAAAAEAIIPHILGMEFFTLSVQSSAVSEASGSSKLAVFFGGASVKNTQINPGGIARHTAQDQLRSLKQAGVECINVSPVRDDMMDDVGATWWPVIPCTDVAVMMGLAHTLVEQDLYDRDFIDRYTVGFDRFLPYLMGDVDNCPKDADWAATISSIPADDIRSLAKRLGQARSLITLSWSLQRQEHGEQSYWMGTTLAAMLGHMGTPGAGICYGLGCEHNVGFASRQRPPFKIAALPQGQNPVTRFIPVARLTDMLEKPGAPFDFNGNRLTYPDIELIYWAGGNPFHHHQDLNRLRQAWARPGTIIVNEIGWTATARHADIVFPSTSPLERIDFAAGSQDSCIAPMEETIPPYAEARDDYEIFSGLAQRLGFLEVFTEGRSALEWVAHLYNETRENAEEASVTLPSFQEFWSGGPVQIDPAESRMEYELEKFRRDPEAYPLATPSGRIEIFSETIQGFGYDDCIGHPYWYERKEWLHAARAATYPFHLISNQPRTKLHSQLDYGVTSRNNKIKGRERARMNPDDAAQRGVTDGDVVEIFNDRGRCLAGVELTPAIRPGVIELPTGAWLDLSEENNELPLDSHGNPNVLTPDRGSSRLGQGPIAHSCLVDVKRFEGKPPEVTAFNQPRKTPR